MKDIKESDLLDLRKASEYLKYRGVPSSTTTIYKLIKNGELQHIKLKKKSYFYKLYLDEYIDANISFHPVKQETWE